MTRFRPSTAHAENIVRWRARVMQVAELLAAPPVQSPPTHRAPPAHCFALVHRSAAAQPVPGESCKLPSFQ